MGYHVSIGCELIILEKNVPIFQKLVRENGHDWEWERGQKVRAKEVNVENVFAEMGFSAKKTQRGWEVQDFIGENYSTEWEKFFEDIAPTIEHGGYMYFDGEDGEKWKWSFMWGRVIHAGSRIVYDDEGHLRIERIR